MVGPPALEAGALTTGPSMRSCEPNDQAAGGVQKRRRIIFLDTVKKQQQTNKQQNNNNIKTVQCVAVISSKGNMGLYFKLGCVCSRDGWRKGGGAVNEVYILLYLKPQGCPSRRQTLSEERNTVVPTGYRLGGLVVTASASRAEGPGFESRLRRDFSG